MDYKYARFRNKRRLNVNSKSGKNNVNNGVRMNIMIQMVLKIVAEIILTNA
jgi:hypothetical protein